MSVDTKDGELVHFPDGDKFEFDQEVAIIFPDMARRSIPNYELMHELHANAVVDWVAAIEDTSEIIRVTDIGASRGDFLSLLWDKMQQYHPHRRWEFTALDSSMYMRNLMIDRFVTEDKSIAVMGYTLGDTEQITPRDQEHVVVCHYVLQFVEPKFRPLAQNQIVSMFGRRGILLFGEKEDLRGYGNFHNAQEVSLAKSMESAYNDFRLQHGYSQEEIDAKTEALQNSMWIEPQSSSVHNFINAGMGFIVPTLRFGQFHSYIMCANDDRSP